MPDIRTVTDMSDVNSAFEQASGGEPVFLTREGRDYVIMELREYKKILATEMLMSELRKGERSGEENGWKTAEEARRILGHGK